VETRKETHRLEIDNLASGRIWYSAFSPDGKVLATVGHGNFTGKDRVMIWDVATGNRIRLMERHTQRSSHVAFSSDGRWLAVGGWDEAMWVWDMNLAEKPIVLPRHAGPVLGVAFSPDGCHLASCGGYKGKGEIKIWDARLWRGRQSPDRLPPAED
jgi:WD40 repeat protein